MGGSWVEDSWKLKKGWKTRGQMGATEGLAHRELIPGSGHGRPWLWAAGPAARKTWMPAEENAAHLGAPVSPIHLTEPPTSSNGGGHCFASAYQLPQTFSFWQFSPRTVQERKRIGQYTHTHTHTHSEHSKKHSVTTLLIEDGQMAMTDHGSHFYYSHKIAITASQHLSHMHICIYVCYSLWLINIVMET